MIDLHGRLKTGHRRLYSGPIVIVIDKEDVADYFVYIGSGR